MSPNVYFYLLFGQWWTGSHCCHVCPGLLSGATLLHPVPPQSCLACSGIPWTHAFPRNRSHHSHHYLVCLTWFCSLSTPYHSWRKKKNMYVTYNCHQQLELFFFFVRSIQWHLTSSWCLKSSSQVEFIITLIMDMFYKAWTSKCFV